MKSAGQWRRWEGCCSRGQSSLTASVASLLLVMAQTWAWELAVDWGDGGVGTVSVPCTQALQKV